MTIGLEKLLSNELSEDLLLETRSKLLNILRERSVLYGDFTLASGQKSNYYMDTRLTTLSADGIFMISVLLLAKIKQIRPSATAVAGPQLGACPLITGISQLSCLMNSQLGLLKGLYVRKATKDHGTQRLIEGPIVNTDDVVMIEDVITTGTSVCSAIEEIKKTGAKTEELICLVLRDEKGKEYIEEKMNVRVHNLFTAGDLL